MEYVIKDSEKVILTERDVKIIQGYADGVSVAKIAADLDISARTVEAIMARLRETMKVKTSVQLVATLIRNKIIE